MIEFSVVTVTYNSETDLLRTQRRFDESVEWLVVDNGSSDRSAAVAEGLGARVIRLTSNLGFAAANNIGIARSRGPHVLCANPDLAFDMPGLLRLRMLDAGMPRAFFVPQLVASDGSPQPNGRGVPTLVRKFASRLRGRARHYLLYASEESAIYVAWAMGAAVFASAATWREISWDESFFVYYEDHDLGLRAWKAGVPVVLVGSVRWEHRWARETTSARLRPWMNEFGGMLRFFRRYPYLLVSDRLVPRWLRVCRESAGRPVEWVHDVGA